MGFRSLLPWMSNTSFFCSTSSIMQCFLSSASFLLVSSSCSTRRFWAIFMSSTILWESPYLFSSRSICLRATAMSENCLSVGRSGIPSWNEVGSLRPRFLWMADKDLSGGSCFAFFGSLLLSTAPKATRTSKKVVFPWAATSWAWILDRHTLTSLLDRVGTIVRRYLETPRNDM